MIISHLDNLVPIVMKGDAVNEASMKKLVGGEEGWDSHVMRVVELGQDGFSPKHTHDWPHINYVIEGEGVLFLNGKENPIKAGSFAYVPSGELHQFRNTGDTPLKFICIVPTEGHA
jgi:quercetin dioxygenase-like cupin family protein